MTAKHRRRETIRTTGRPVEAPAPPPGLSAARKQSWAAYWQSEAGIATATTGDFDSATTLWGLYREVDRVSKLLRAAPAMTTGSMGQQRVNPLAARHMELNREIRQRERGLAIGGPVNRQRLPEVDLDPRYLLARMNAMVELPDLNDPEFGGSSHHWIRDPHAMTDDELERVVADRLRDGRAISEQIWTYNMVQLEEVIAERGIDQGALLHRAQAANEANEVLLLAEWERMLAEAQQHATWADAGTEAETRLRARISVLEELVGAAAERGVMWAQASPWRKAQLVGA